MLKEKSIIAGTVCAVIWVGTLCFGQTVEVRTLFDLDHNSGTGCTLSTVDGNFLGVEEVLITTVDVPSSQVVRLERQVCVGGVLGPRSVIDASVWNVGLGLGGARAIGIILDGNPSDWFAEDLISTDPTGDSPDIAAVYGRHEHGQVYLRIDINLNKPPVADPISTNVNEDDSILIGLTASDVDGDSLVFSIESNPNQGTLGALSPTRKISSWAKRVPTTSAIIYSRLVSRARNYKPLAMAKKGPSAQNQLCPVGREILEPICI